jgi:hypothetical protein
VDVEDPCCLTFAGCDLGTAVESVTKRRGLVRLRKHDYRGVAMFAAASQLFIMARCGGAYER